jgi:two-component system response regulator FixJ
LPAAEPVVYIVDDEAAIRDSLAMLLGAVGLATRCYASAKDFLAQYREDSRACLVADVRMPGLSGLELQEALRSRGAELPVIVITGHGDVAMAVRAMKAGASDFIEKPFNDQVMIDAVHRALARSAEEGGARPQAAARSVLETRIAQLTPREKEVMLLVAEGRPNKVVATRLGLSTRTVEVHRAKLMEKMGARSLADLVRMAIVCELLPP